MEDFGLVGAVDLVSQTLSWVHVHKRTDPVPMCRSACNVPLPGMPFSGYRSDFGHVVGCVRFVNRTSTDVGFLSRMV